MPFLEISYRPRPPAANSFLLFQTQLGNLPLAIKDEPQEQKMFAHFGPVAQRAAAALDLAPCE